MSNESKKKSKDVHDAATRNKNKGLVNGQEANEKLGNKKYEGEMFKLQTELVKLQEWAKVTGARVVILFEGRDAAGKGGIIKRIAELISPRVFRVVALPAPTDRAEDTDLSATIHRPSSRGRRDRHLRSQLVQPRGRGARDGLLQQAGTTAGSCKNCPSFEASLVNDGIILLKYWLEVSEKEQHERFLARIKDTSKRWKLSPMDLESHRRWYDYSRARDAMLDRDGYCAPLGSSFLQTTRNGLA